VGTEPLSEPAGQPLSARQRVGSEQRGASAVDFALSWAEPMHGDMASGRNGKDLVHELRVRPLDPLSASVRFEWDRCRNTNANIKSN
jgi:hypothetical protein